MESSEERRARLAALRKKNKQREEGNRITEASLNLETVADASGEGLISSEGPSQPSAQDDLPIQLPPQQIEGGSSLTFQVSEDTTVEAVAADIQRAEFERILADDTPTKTSYTKDLEGDIEGLLHRARVRTDRAINDIIRQKYQELVQL